MRYGIDLMKKLKRYDEKTEYTKYLELIEEQLHDTIFMSILKFVEFLFKYEPKFCLTKLKLSSDPSQELSILEIIMGLL